MSKYNIDLAITGTENGDYTGDSEIVLNRDGIVIHTATVTDENDAGIGKGKVVEFYKNYKLLGKAITNNSGVATLRATYDVGTYYITAKIKEFGQIARIHVVNPYNKFPLSVQSGGDIENITSSNYTYSSVFSNNSGSISRTNEWSANGNTSIKITTNNPINNNWIRFIIPTSNDDSGKTLTFQVKTHIPQGNGLLKIYFVTLNSDESQNYILKKEITLPKSELNSIEVSDENITEGVTKIVIQFELNKCKTMYIDNLECYIN